MKADDVYPACELKGRRLCFFNSPKSSLVTLVSPSHAHSGNMKRVSKALIFGQYIWKNKNVFGAHVIITFKNIFYNSSLWKLFQSINDKVLLYSNVIYGSLKEEFFFKSPVPNWKKTFVSGFIHPVNPSKLGIFVIYGFSFFSSYSLLH